MRAFEFGAAELIEQLLSALQVIPGNLDLVLPGFEALVEDVSHG